MVDIKVLLCRLQLALMNLMLQLAFSRSLPRAKVDIFILYFTSIGVTFSKFIYFI